MNEAERTEIVANDQRSEVSEIVKLFFGRRIFAGGVVL
jgi:hypothetical protein